MAWLGRTWAWLLNASTDQKVLGGLVLFNLVGLIFLIVSNLIKTYQDIIFHRKKVWIEREVVFLESQLSSFYGPIYSLLKANKAIMEALVQPASGLRDRQPEIVK